MYILISNYFDHHIKFLCDALFRETSGAFIFLGTEEMTEERKRLGWGNIDIPDYVQNVNLRDKKDVHKWQQKILEADIVHGGGVPLVLMKKRHKAQKITIQDTERVFKQRIPWLKIPYMVFKEFVLGRRPHKNEYMLAASAYNPYDYSLLGKYVGKTYRWGYFTEFKRYDVDTLFARKDKNRIETNHGVTILWTARFIGLKHPEKAIYVAERLAIEGIPFHMNLIGCGELEEDIRNSIKEKKLDNKVAMLGSMTPQEVRKHMEISDIFLFTSDRNEGWGAVLNESMNSGCAVVACEDIGAVPFLIRDGENGFVYRNDDFDGFYAKVKKLVLEPALRNRIGRAAYNTIASAWNPEIAANRLIALYNNLIIGKDTPFSEGPCSKAPIIKNV